ncbi:MAG: hypothetical protein GJU72_02030 [Acidithiobacillus ferriphilus]|jgi:hypothetical protein|uniref:hypothetical protein n=1 Tax=Acidithiobacillus ferriphilus TaxID=1689834 RepID=UPI00242FD5FD|nr:hypothetical protein [Acidithiobacillus ferriphilus]MBW9247873.1 hypothetical protein [Acidithiobacillus ferriphilus]MBW9253883.1 hypothetical protein [Acidithiobacillus ferriphilus]
MSSKSTPPTPRPGRASLEERRAQQRAAARIYRAKQEADGRYQTIFWMTMRQAVAVREWLRRGGDVSVLRSNEEKGEHHG